jgi:hypothetical protein
MAKMTMKNRRITRISLSMIKDWKRAFNIFLKVFTRDTDFRGLSTLSTLRGFKLKSSEIFCKRLDTIMIKSS